MTATIEEPLAPALPLQPRSPRPARTAAASHDPHSQLIEALDRLVSIAAATELTAQDALGGLAGALINAMQPGAKPLSKHRLIELVDRVADGLGCPPVPLAAEARRVQRAERVARLAQVLADYPSPFQAAAHASSDFRVSRSDADWDQVCAAAEVLHDEFDVRVGR